MLCCDREAGVDAIAGVVVAGAAMRWGESQRRHGTEERGRRERRGMRKGASHATIPSCTTTRKRTTSHCMLHTTNAILQRGFKTPKLLYL